MANGFCKVIVGGHIGNIDVRYTTEDKPVVNLSMAEKKRYKGEENTEWHRIVCFGKTAELVSQYLDKGSYATFEGSLQTRKWQDKNGNDRYTTEIVADRVHFGPGDKKVAQQPKDHAPPADPKPDDDMFDDIPF